MVRVKHFFLVISVLLPGSFSRPQETQENTAKSKPESNDYVGFDYGQYDYGKHYDDYVKQYNDYVKQYGDYGAQYGDYGPSTDYGVYEHAWQYEEDYGFYDDVEFTTDYPEYFVFGDRNSPLDTMVHIYEETAQSQMPWVYIIVPVVQIDVLYVDPEHEQIDDIEMQFPIETFFFELGDFGMGHFGLGDFGLGDFGLGDYHHTADYGIEHDYGLPPEYDEYNDYPVYGNYQGTKADLFDTADELTDLQTLDYPGIDHDPYWIDWIFMLPPDEMRPVFQ